ncbi:MAG TPA: endonuclease/exonuclease/phosphatase family protein [Candidatus Saccharimonadales bacterium]
MRHNDAYRTNRRLRSKGSHDLVLIGIIIVFILSVLGFIAYSAWDKQSTKAGGDTPVIRVATYNILSQQWDGQTKLDTWSQRKSRVFSKIDDAAPGIIGLQEVTNKYPNKTGTSSQRSAVVSFMESKGYASHVGSRDNSDPIFYKRSAFTYASKGEQLIVPKATSADAKGPAARYLTWLRLKKNGENILALNYHFNQYRMADDREISRLREKLALIKRPGDHIIFTGDFNGRDYKVRNAIGLWKMDKADSVNHILATYNVSREGVPGWRDYGKGNPAASDHSLILVRAGIQ